MIHAKPEIDIILGVRNFLNASERLIRNIPDPLFVYKHIRVVNQIVCIFKKIPIVKLILIKTVIILILHGSGRLQIILHQEHS